MNTVSRLFTETTLLLDNSPPFQIILTLDTLEYIVSKPLVQRSRETNIPGWLALPFIGCLIVGSILTFSTESTLNAKDQTNFRWYGPLFMATGCEYLSILNGVLLTSSPLTQSYSPQLCF